MSQQGKAGLSAPRFAVGSCEPDVVGPKGSVWACVSAATPAGTKPCVLPCDGADVVVRFSFGDDLGVGQVALTTSGRYSGTVFWLALRFRNAAHFAIVSSSRSRFTEVGVGHVAATCRGN
jgi:hypothetical protein